MRSLADITGIHRSPALPILWKAIFWLSLIAAKNSSPSISMRIIWPDRNESMAFVAAHFAQAGATDPVDKALRLDTNIMLVDDPVKRVDNMTMAWGLEARVPFLDHEVVELAGPYAKRPQTGS